MNRKKAIKQEFIRKLKQERARNSVYKKERYISKAERAEMALIAENEQEQVVDETKKTDE